MSDANEEPKIIIDEDWKSQVEREKAEAAAKKKAAAEQAGDEAPSEDAESSVEQPAGEAKEQADAPEASPAESLAGEAEAAGGAQPPEASIPSMVTLFFTQAMMSLGQFPDPAGGKPEVDKPLAKHYIDLMEVLQEKTKGNLSAEEEKMLAEALHACRMAFVSG